MAPLLIALILFPAAFPSAAEEEKGKSAQDPVRGRVQLDETYIFGDSGTAKVVNIVPWKDAKPVGKDDDLNRSFRDELLAPIQYETFLRQYGEGTAR
jgi:hypothetical protein